MYVSNYKFAGWFRQCEQYKVHECGDEQCGKPHHNRPKLLLQERCLRRTEDGGSSERRVVSEHLGYKCIGCCHYVRLQ